MTLMVVNKLNVSNGSFVTRYQIKYTSNVTVPNFSAFLNHNNIFEKLQTITVLFTIC